MHQSSKNYDRKVTQFQYFYRFADTFAALIKDWYLRNLKYEEHH